MSGVLVYSDRDELAFDLLGWAVGQQAALGSVQAAVLGPEAEDRAKAYLGYGPERVYVSADAALANLPDDVLAAALAQIVEQANASLVLVGATRRGRALAPRLAQKIGAGCVSDVVDLEMAEGRLIAGRYALGGNTLSREVVKSERQVVCVMPGTVDSAASSDGGGEVIALSLSLTPSKAAVVDRTEKPPATVNIADSDRVVCVGRGLENQEDLALVENLADALGGEVACTRPLSSEFGWIAEERMIGISGEKCSPQVLISLGISGQVQHTVGIVGAKAIVAVNTDANAPIFKMADYGIVGDLLEVAPALTEALKRRGGS
ncbi:MAG: electron transfer flavoprotein subunit alpha/FixB family protein [Anaerolineales bacterium]|jgi:electron transfer flavoprotein alpha subunit